MKYTPNGIFCLFQGGALSSLFAFYAAADEEITHLTISPIRVITVASPYVGNKKFLLAFQALESEKRLQHLRIANKEDIITKMPRVAPNILNGGKPTYYTLRPLNIE